MISSPAIFRRPDHSLLFLETIKCGPLPRFLLVCVKCSFILCLFPFLAPGLHRFIRFVYVFTILRRYSFLTCKPISKGPLLPVDSGISNILYISLLLPPLFFFESYSPAEGSLLRAGGTFILGMWFSFPYRRSPISPPPPFHSRRY